MESVGHSSDITRRAFLSTTAVGTAAAIAGSSLFAGEETLGPGSPYERANTDWLAKCRFGVGIHWTAQTVPRSDPPKPFQKAVANFDLKGFMAAVDHAGADYVLFAVPDENHDSDEDIRYAVKAV